MDDFLINLNSGRIQMIQEHRGLQGLEHEFRRLGNRIAAGLLVCGLTIASAISLHAPNGPRILGFPLVSIGLFTLTIVLGLWTLNGLGRD